MIFPHQPVTPTLPQKTRLHQHGHDGPEVVGVLGIRLVERHRRLLLLLVVEHAHIGHEEVREELLVRRLLLYDGLVQLTDLVR